jgi:hypothetical protein
MITPRSIIYQGPSAFQPHVDITAVLNLGRDGNDKTAGLTQLYILPTAALYGDRAPIGPTKELSAAICGTCPLRSKLSGGNGQCYAYGTVLLNGAYAVQRALKTGHVVPWSKKKRPYPTLRSAAIGDPAALPPEVMLRLISDFPSTRGYTQKWRTALHLQPTHMASVHNAEDQAAAAALGWRTFRVRPIGAPLLSTEVGCPASKEAGYLTDCATCTLCTGARRPTAAHVSNIDHGPLATAKKRTLRIMEAA